MDCDTCNPICTDTWPMITPNSLRIVKLPARDTLSWSIASGSGSVNVHLVGGKSLLENLHLDMAILSIIISIQRGRSL